jgi:hypothetical protein
MTIWAVKVVEFNRGFSLLLKTAYHRIRLTVSRCFSICNTVRGVMFIYTAQLNMPGGGRSDSSAVRIIGGIVALIAVVGYLVLGWPWGSGDLSPTAIGTVVAVLIIVWSFYKVESFTGNL